MRTFHHLLSRNRHYLNRQFGTTYNIHNSQSLDFLTTLSKKQINRIHNNFF